LFGLFKLFRKKPPQAPAPAAPPAADVLERIIPIIKVAEPGPGGITLPPGADPVVRPFAGDLVVMYAEDLPGHFAYLSHRRMRELGLEPASLHALAVRNLPGRIEQIQLLGSAPRFMITAGGNLEATLLLHPTLWESLAEHLPGAPMAVVPSRDLLFVTGADSEEGRAFLKQAAEKELEDKRYALSRRIFIRHDGAWTVTSSAS
jgi:hypothetical protein